MAGVRVHSELNSASWGVSGAGDVACLLLLARCLCTAYTLTVVPTIPSPSQVIQPVTGSSSRVADPRTDPTSRIGWKQAYVALWEIAGARTAADEE